MKEHKESIIKIGLTVILFLAAVIVDKTLTLPVFGRILLYVIPYLVAGYEAIAEAFKNIFHGEFFDEAFLMVLATVAAFIIGEYPEAVFVMLFFNVGELFEDIASDNSRKKISSLMDLKAETVSVERDGVITTVDPKDVKVGEIIVVKPGEKIALDGTVAEGESSVDNSALTGESVPVDVKASDRIYSGGINLNAVLKIKVESEYKDSTVARILDLVEHSADKKAKTEKFITKFSKVYTPIVVILAILYAIIPSIITGDFHKYIYSAISFLVVSCPCALVISVPLTYFCAIGGASRDGILIKGAEAIENLTHAKCCIFDKTGTLTKGKFQVVAIHPESIDEDALLTMAARVESFSSHPISQSIIAAAKIKKLDYEGDISDVKELSGMGMSAVTENKEQLLVGNEKLMTQNGIEYHSCHIEGTVIHVACGGKYAGHIVISDVLKSESISAIKKLKAEGIKTVMLTGDKKAAAENIAKLTKIDEYHCELMPADKVKKTEEIMAQENGKTVFTGDGINDAPVLMRADVGIAMGGLGSDAAIEAADIVIMDDNISKVSTCVKISKYTNSIAVQNIVFSISIKILVLILSIIGIPGVMWLAAIADVGVMVIAVCNAMRALKTKF